MRECETQTQTRQNKRNKWAGIRKNNLDNVTPASARFCRFMCVCAFVHLYAYLWTDKEKKKQRVGNATRKQLEEAEG